MSKTVDERVVEMRFDNRQFEQNVSTSMSTLDKLKHSLNLSGAAKGLTDVGNAAKSIDMSGLGSTVETVRAKFSALQVMGVTALANITNSAVNAGKRIINALTLEPIMSGFQEYETQINAVQTILANTKSKGSTLDDVNKALDELNHYADKTIYNFTEMTRNIGTFTAAGIDLDTSVSAIQGIANLAAVSGSTSQQASTAMYQLSQALATGTVKLMDWNSVVNAGMGGEIFQNALKETSKELGTGAAAAIKAKGSFRESLQTGWLTSQVLTETLKKFTTSGANEYVAEYTGLSKEAVEAALKDAKAKYGEADAIKYASKALAEKSGKNEDEIKSVLEMAETAENAATKVKTFTQLWETLKEAAQSGWTESWEIIIGDFEEAKELLTNISDTVGAMIQKSADARNQLLQGWKDMGGRDDLLEGFKNIFDGIMSIVKPIKEAFSEVFRAIAPSDLVDITKRFKDFTSGLILTGEKAEKVKRIFKGLFSVFDIVRKVLLTVGNTIAKLLGSEGFSSLGDLVLDVAAAIGDFFTSLNKSFDTDGLSGVLSKIVSGLSDFLVGAGNHLRGFGDVLSFVGDLVTTVCGKIWESFKNVFGWISDNVSAGDIFAGLAGSGIFMAGKKISSFLDNIVKAIKSLFGGKKNGITHKISEVLDSVRDSLSAFTSGIKITSLVSIAIAIGILSMALRTISQIDTGDIVKSLAAIGAMLLMLSGTLKSMTKTLGSFGSKGLIKSGISLIFVAKAIDILAGAMKKISEMSLGDLAKGLIGVGAGLAELSIALRIIGQTKIPLRTSIAMLALAESCKKLANALVKFGGMAWDEIGRGLTAMGGALGEFVVALAVLNKFGGGKSIFGSIALLIAVQSLSKMADGLKKFGSLSWDEIKRGLVGMGGALGELAIALTVVGKIAGFSSLFAAGSISIVIQGLGDLVDAFVGFGVMAWDEIGRGLAGMGGALGEVAGVAGLLGKLAGFSSLFGAGSIVAVITGLSDLADAFKKFGEMAWDEIGRSLVGMGGALSEVAGITGLLGKLAGFSSLFGAGSIVAVITGLSDLADAFKKFGGMDWDEIARGLVGMGGALGEVAIIAGILGTLAGLPALLGSGAIYTAVQSLGDLADAFKKFGEMSWDEIGRGLSAMGGALGETALGGVLNTLSGLGAMSISTLAEPLGMLADSVKKWTGVTIPDGFNTKLADLANAVGLFTFEGLGASALSTAAPGVGTMADSVRKWIDLSVPENIVDNMGLLANAIEEFTLSGIGGNSLSVAAPAVGDMADSIKKWSDVAIPDGLEEGLTGIANGVKSFSFAFAGGWSMSALVGPLGGLADSVKKWNGVRVPETLEDDLNALANGVNAFKWAFGSGWSIGQVTKPLGDLGGAIKKWDGVSIPSDLGDRLKTLAGGIKSFSGVKNITPAADGMSKISSAVEKLSGIGYETITSGLNSLVDSIKNLASIDTVSDSLSKFGNNLVDEIITPIKNASSKFSDVGSEIANSLIKGFDSRKTSITTSVTTAITQTISKLNSKKTSFNSTGSSIASALATGASSKSTKISTAFTSAIQSAISSAKLQRANFYSAGGYLAEGFANGIGDNAFKAEAKAVAMAKAALEAAKEALGIASPSKEAYKIGDYYGLGFVKALDDYSDKVYGASNNMAEYAKKGLSEAINEIRSNVDANMDARPTIRPVVDLSDIKTGANAITDLLSTKQTIGLVPGIGAVNSMMNRRSQNGSNMNIVSAIDKLRKDVSGISRPSYTINGITYDDGSEVSDAIQTLVRAAKIERRV